MKENDRIYEEKKLSQSYQTWGLDKMGKRQRGELRGIYEGKW